MLAYQSKTDIGFSLIVPLAVLLLVGLLAGGTGAAAAQGSSFDDAAPLSEGTTNGNISAGSTDFYQVEANTTDALDVRLTPDVEDLEYYIYDSNREEIAGNGFVTSDETARLTRKLPQTGTYYIEVTGNEDSTTTDYTLDTDIVTPTENDDFAPNDNFESAAGIDEGILDATVWGGESDFYRLEANTTDALDIRFTPQSTELEIYVYDRNRETIASDGFASDGETTRLVQKLPQTGTYYIEVAGTEAGTTTDYTLNTDIVTPTENDAFAPNDDFESAATIEQKFTDATIWGGESDFYQVDANTTDALDVRLTPQSSDLEYYLYDSNRETIASDTFVENDETDRITKKLPRNGTYYIEVTGDEDSTTTDYTLNTEVITPSKNDAFAPNDEFESAAVIEEEFSDATIWGGESDFYRVGLGAQETWTVDLTTQQAEMEFFLYAPNQTRLATDRFVSDTGELSITASQAGTYYLEVTTDSSEATTDYSIQSTQTGDSNTPPTAAFTSSQLTPPVGESITFDASNSTDPDGQIERYEWDFDGDGTVEASGETVTHTYNNAGNYTATLTVSDTTGLSATTSQIITVEEQDNRLNVENDGVSITGSEIRISVEDRSSFTVTGLPGDVSVSPGDNGIYDSSAGEIRYESPTAQLPETVTFTLTPGESYEVGDTIEFTVDGESVSLPVTEAPTVPTQLADEDVSAASYNAVVGSDEQLGAGNLAGAIQSWAGDDGSQPGFIGDTDVGAGELSQMINYWSSEIAG